MVSGRYLRTRATQLLTDRIKIFRNEDLDVSNQSYLNEHTERVKWKNEQNPQMEYNWVIRLPDIYINSNLVSIPNSFEEPEFSVEPERIEHRVETLTAPFPNFESSKYTDGTSFMYAATHGDIGQITMVLDEFEDGATISYFRDWHNKIRNKDGTHNVPAFYKYDIVVYDIDSRKLTTNSTIFRGVWPVSIEATGRNQAGNGKLQFTVTLSVDANEYVRISPQQILDRLNDAQQAFIDNAIQSNGVSTNAPDFLVDTLDAIVGVRDLIF